ncbi:bifunctional histidinol-phosphatase/imidazoleglycerol-phosphate dehydratase HisB [Buchnera aphidicola]|uniref:bifunctional histidinol-phosphatase/imidazoleglycerol-phosphate dehydratase HisB n=1 Tax=Buchnera aphidicola TaxID=9 RepID=UPI00094D1FE2|nr:bifunctional histidinol-phosphatase/imidazoleglycerol-phosphate dehydratase HisB [Buchnera aphidicola]
MIKKFIFIDRDGTLIREPKDYQIDSLNKLFFEPYVIVSLLKLIRFGYHLILITNQDGLGSPNFLIKNFSVVQNFMLQVFASQGIFFESILICPHYIHDNCNCRKPKVELVKHWLYNNIMDKKYSCVIGDRKTDLQLAKNMGIRGFLYHSKELSWKKITDILTKVYRSAVFSRTTNETKVFIKINLDQSIKNYINTGIDFLNHMLDQVRVHSGISLYIHAQGDLKIDDHHTIEDIGIALGLALKKALGNKFGIARYGFTLPMDESLSSCFLDFSGRSCFIFKVKFKNKFIGDLSSCMIKHFFDSLSQSMQASLHIYATGENDHHCAEGIFKSFGRALRQAIHIQDKILPTSKGLL